MRLVKSTRPSSTVATNIPNEIRTGTIIKTNAILPTNEYLRLDGKLVSKSLYSNLFAILDHKYDDMRVFGVEYHSFSTIGCGQPWKQQYDFNTANDFQLISNHKSIYSDDFNRFLVNGFEIVVTKNRVFLIDGLRNGDNHSRRIFTANINSDGTIGEIVSATHLFDINNRALGLAFFKLICIKNNIYIFGGRDEFGNTNNTIFRAPILPNGDFGEFTPVDSLPLQNFSGFSLLLTKNRLFIIGGAFIDAGGHFTASNSIFTSSIDSNGNLSSFTLHGIINNDPNATISDIAFSGSILVQTRNKVFLIGGTHSPSGQISNNLFVCDVLSDGSISQFTLYIPPGPNTVPRISSSDYLVTRNKVFIFGGRSNWYDHKDILSFDIDINGDLTNYGLHKTLIYPFRSNRVFVTKTRLYCLVQKAEDQIAVEEYMLIGGEGFNSYESFYNGSINTFLDTHPHIFGGILVPSSTNPNTQTLFRLPDFTYQDNLTPGFYSYIKT